MKSVSISQSMVPGQEHTRQSFPAPRQFAPNDWQFELGRAQQLDWQPGNAIQSDNNYFTKNEGHQKIKNGMFGVLTGQEPIYGFVEYRLNPLAQEQTNSHMSGYNLQKVTRISDNMNPNGVMRFPPFTYPTNGPPNGWVNHYTGSTRR